MKLRQQQIKCINAIQEHFEIENNALIKMFCGVGKSFVIFDSLLRHGEKLSVVVVPSINLITQFNKDYFLDNSKKEYNRKYFNKEYELLTICSKNELDKNLQNEFKFTTDEDEILEFLDQEEDKIILVTYQSLELLFNIIKEYEFEIDYVLMKHIIF